MVIYGCNCVRKVENMTHTSRAYAHVNTCAYMLRSNVTQVT